MDWVLSFAPWERHQHGAETPPAGTAEIEALQLVTTGAKNGFDLLTGLGDWAPAHPRPAAHPVDGICEFAELPSGSDSKSFRRVYCRVLRLYSRICFCPTECVDKPDLFNGPTGDLKKARARDDDSQTLRP